jgi:hypothetical protein
MLVKVIETLDKTSQFQNRQMTLLKPRLLEPTLRDPCEVGLGRFLIPAVLTSSQSLLMHTCRGPQLSDDN